MRIIARNEDKEFPYIKTTHVRKVVRGIVFDDDYKIALMRVKTCDDIFGERDLYETPGGGVEKGETLLEAFKREIFEEVGAILEDDIIELGRVIDFYNKIYRQNDNHFYLAKIKSLGERHLVEYEAKWEIGLVFMEIDEAIKAYENTRNLPVNNLVRERELPVLRMAKRKIEQIKRKKLS